MRIRCPHCHNPIEVVDETSLNEVHCPACGSSFSLIDDETTRTHYSGTRRIGRFELVRELGIGHFGSVWMARDTELDRTVAIKMPRKGTLDAGETELFFRDARAAAQLQHPHIVSVHEVGRDQNTVYIVSDYVEGANLKEWLSGARLSFRESAELVVRIAEALEHAHQAGVVHRDLKPGNIMVDRDGQPHVIDFGLAKRNVGEITMTMHGQVLGTPAYMSPEQAHGKGHEADARSDIYAVGTILYELLTGELPFRGDAAMLLLQIQRDEPPRPRKLNARIPRDLETITLKCLQKEPARRYQTARQLADDLKRHLDGKPILARPVGRAERAWRWTRRNPVVAGLSTAVVVALVSGTIVSAYFAATAIAQRNIADQKAAEALAQKKRANDNAEKERLASADAQRQAEAAQRAREQAETNLVEARRQRELAETQLYFSQISNAVRALTSDASFAVRKLGEADVQRREWEWHYLWRLARANVHELKFDRQRLFMPGERTTDFSPELVRVIEDDSGRLLYVWRQDDRLRTGLVDESEQVAPIGETKIKGDQVAMSPAGVYAAALDTSSKTLTVWPILRPGEQVRVSGVRGTLPPWGISDDGQWFAVALGESQSQLCRVGDKLVTPIQHGRKPDFLGFSSGGDFLVSWGFGQIRLYRPTDLHDRQPASVSPFAGHDSRSRQVAMDPHGKWLAAPSRNNGVMLWNAESREIAQTFSGGERATRALAFSHCGQRLATLDAGGTLRLWDRRSGEPLLEWDELAGKHSTINFGPRDRHMFVFQPGGKVAKWRAELPPPDGNLHGHQEFVRMIELSPDGRRLLSSSYDGTAKLWDTQTQRELLILRGHAATVDGVRFQPHGPLVATGGWDRTVRLWDAESGKTVHILEGHTDRVVGTAFHPEGQLLASIGSDGAARLWDVAEGTLLRTLETGAAEGWRITFSPDGKRLAAATGRGVVVWRTADWQEAYRIAAHKRVVHCVTYSPDGRTIATCGFDKQIHLTDADTGNHLCNLGAHGDLAYFVDFSPDGRFLVSAGRDKLLKYWDVEQRRLVGETRFPNPRAFPMVALFLADGKRIVMSGWDMVVRILDVPPAAQSR